MKFIAGSKHAFNTGTILDPEDLTDEFDYLNQCMGDVRQQRIVRTMASYNLNNCNDVLYGINPERCAVRFTAPVSAELEKIWIGAYYQAAVQVDGYLLNSDGTNVSSIANPHFSLPATDGYVVSFNDVVGQQPLRMTAGTEYILQIRPDSSGQFLMLKLDLGLVFKTDLFGFTDVNILDRLDYQFSEYEAPNATKVSNLTSTAASTISTITSASNTGCYRATLFQLNPPELFSSITNANLLKFTIPSTPTNGDTYFIKQQYLWAVFNSSGSCSITATIKDKSGSTLSTLTASGTVGTNHLVSNSSSSTVHISGTNGASDSSEDCSVSFTVNSGTCANAYLLVWTI